MNKKWLITILFTLSYAVVISMGLTCLLHLFSGVLASALFGGSFAVEHPRYVAFLVIAGSFALLLLASVFYVDLRLSGRLALRGWIWAVKIIFAILISVPMTVLWHMLFECLQRIF